MRIEALHRGSLTLTEATEIVGTVDGDVIVKDGLSLDLSGTITGDLLVAAGGSALVRGTVRGSVFSHGGKVQIYGRVSGVADACDVRPGAVVGL